MKTLTNVTLYFCDGCNKRYVKKIACEAHEKTCSRVVGNRPQCTGCSNFTKEKAVYDDPWSGSEQETGNEIFLCKKYNEHMVSKKGATNGFLSSICSMDMPTDADEQCKFFSGVIDE
jgi:hypothetical protein